MGIPECYVCYDLEEQNKALRAESEKLSRKLAEAERDIHFLNNEIWGYRDKLAAIKVYARDLKGVTTIWEPGTNAGLLQERLRLLLDYLIKESVV